MPNKSIAVNLRRLYINMKTPVDNGWVRALLSLDANKAFDGVEWCYL